MEEKGRSWKYKAFFARGVANSSGSMGAITLTVAFQANCNGNNIWFPSES